MTNVVRVTIDEQSPWPGLGSFDEGAERFFNGRQNESAELRRLALNAPLTLLFGASGLGKTSLVQAGLFPLLRKEHFLPVYVRLDLSDRTAPLIEQVKFALQSQLKARRVDAPAMHDGESLWSYLHHDGLELWSEQNQLLTPVFVFDQFEEVFTLGTENPAAVARLRIDLADLIENRLPATLADNVKSNEAASEALSLDSQRYKVVLSFREDFLPAVEGWKRELPSILHNRLRLLPMSAQRAFEAVHKTAPRLVDEELAKKIVDFVAAAQQDGTGKANETLGEHTDLAVEPALLSLVCSGLNEKRKAQGKSAFDVELLAGSGQSIISDYYAKSVGDLPDRVQRFIENELITERGFRKPCDIDDAHTVHGVTDQQLRLLVDRRVLRIEPQRGTERVELTHDLLTGVVREHRDRQRERARSRRQRRRMIIVTAIVLLLAGLVLKFWRLSVAAREQAVLAEQQKREAEHQSRVASYESYKSTVARWDAERQRGEAEKQTGIAKERSEVAQEQARISASRQLAAQALGQYALQPDLALLLAVEGYRAADTYEARNSLLNILEREARTTLNLHALSSTVAGMAFSTDGKVFVWGTAAGVVEVWDAVARRLLRRLSGPPMATLALSPDGRTLVTASEEGALLVREISGGAKITQLSVGDGTRVSHLAFSPQGGTIAAGTVDGTVVLWNAASWQRVTPVLKSSGGISSMAFSADGSTLAIGHDSGMLELWSVGKREQAKRTIRAGELSVNGVAFSPDGKILASVSGYDGIQLWDVARGAKLGDGVGHGLLMTVAFSADGRTVAAGAREGSISVWDFRDRQLRERGQPLIGDGSEVLGIALAPDSQTLASLSTYSIIFRNISDTQPQPLSGPLTGCSASGSSLAFSPDGKALASGGVDGGIILWDLVRHKCVALDGGVHESLTALAFSPDGTRLASSGGGRVKLWDTVTRRQSGEVFTENVTGLAFSPGGLTLAGSHCSTQDTSEVGRHRGSPCTKGEILLWDVRTHKVRGHIPTGEDAADRITFSPNGKMLASISHGTMVMLWDVAARRAAGPPLSLMQGNVRAISFSPDGRTLAAQKQDRGIELWDVTSHSTYDDSILTWNRISRLPLEEGPAAEITLDVSTFSPDLKTVASAARKTLLLQDVSTKQQLGPPLDGQVGDITSVAFSPDAKALASGTSQQILLWDLSPESWQVRACRVANRNLSQREWNDHFGRQPYRKTCGELPIHPSAFQSMVDREEAALTAGDSVALTLARREVAEATAELDDAALLNLICWNEAMKGFGGIVLPLCERAVELVPESAEYRDSRALARALTGDYSGAVEDFSFYLKSGTDEDLRKQRQTWIAELKQGRNPFNALSLRELRVFFLRKQGVTVGARKQ